MIGITKSPFNYIGNKYRIMDKIRRLFPENINVYVDLFCGGCDATINVDARIKYANDINCYLIGICKAFQNNAAIVIPYIESTIEKWELSKTNECGYKKFRDYYNDTRNPLDLYVLMCYSFNYQFRFNSAHDYNNPFGKNRSSFNSVMKKNLQEFLIRIREIHFSSIDFEKFDFSALGDNDFVYCDPPYLLTCGSYNDGKRGFKGWGIEDDIRLFGLLDSLNEKNIKFALSNVVVHKNIVHEKLVSWVEKRGYSVHAINYNYNNCNYHTKNADFITKEVLITNY